MFKNKLYPIFGILLLAIIFSYTNKQKISLQTTLSTRIKLEAIGSNTFGQLGKTPSELASGQTTPDTPSNIVEVAAGRNSSLLLTKNGKIWSWGGNEWGQLGYTTDSYHESQAKEVPELSEIVALAANNNHVLALKQDGTVWAFGFNFSGQLGNGNNENSPNAIQVKNIDHVSDITAGYKFSMAVKDDGSVWGWGAMCDGATKKAAQAWWEAKEAEEQKEEEDPKRDGSYYDPTSEALVYYDKNEYCINEDIVGILSRTPKRIEGLQDIQKISAGYGHVLAVDEQSNVWSFGCNTYQQLGRETKKKSENTTPQEIEGLSNIQEVSAGFRHSLALRKDGTVLAWGHNYKGQLGDGTTTDTMHPITVPIDHVAHIFAGYDYTFALKDDGTVWGWGRNTGEWFGGSDVEFVKTPTKVSNLTHVVQLAAGGSHILALSKDN